tara:strand:+ start:9774 stop:10406 length:633 start_codon:yes stop_codon:yes gene_type:complete
MRVLTPKEDMDDFEIVVYEVPDQGNGIAWGGETTYETKDEPTTYQAKFSCEPLVAYCPHCTKTKTWDKKWREYRPRKMQADDFKQKWMTIADEVSPTGQTNQCRSCGLRMSEYDPEEENLIPESEPEEEIEMEWVNEGYLHDGAWWIPKDIFFDLMKRGFGKKIQYAFVIEGQARLMPIDKLITMAKSRGFVERSSSEDMGIPIPLFQTL